jgi:hypothetical protein
LDFKNVIIDEYLFYSSKNRKQIHKIFTDKDWSFMNISIFSTPEKQYDKQLFEIIKHEKSHKFCGDSLNYTNQTELDGKFDIDEMNDLYFNFITDKNIRIIHDENHSYFTNKRFIDIGFNLVKYLSKEEYEMAVYGKFLKEKTCPNCGHKI